jgi:hypothetical protein
MHESFAAATSDYDLCAAVISSESAGSRASGSCFRHVLSVHAPIPGTSSASSVSSVQKAGFRLPRVENVYLDVKTIEAVPDAQGS